MTTSIHSLGAHHAGRDGAGNASVTAAELSAADTTHDPDRLSAWTGFHREVEALPAEEREAFDLLFYQELPQAEAAALLDVSVRTIKRRWQAARLRLVENLGGKMPGL